MLICVPCVICSNDGGTSFGNNPRVASKDEGMLARRIQVCETCPVSSGNEGIFNRRLSQKKDGEYCGLDSFFNYGCWNNAKKDPRCHMPGQEGWSSSDCCGTKGGISDVGVGCIVGKDPAGAVSFHLHHHDCDKTSQSKAHFLHLN